MGHFMLSISGSNSQDVLEKFFVEAMVSNDKIRMKTVKAELGKLLNILRILLISSGRLDENSRIALEMEKDKIALEKDKIDLEMEKEKTKVKEIEAKVRLAELDVERIKAESAAKSGGLSTRSVCETLLGVDNED
jgi:hypothetical protein